MLNYGFGLYFNRSLLVRLQARTLVKHGKDLRLCMLRSW